MRSLNKKIAERIHAQSQEAEAQGLTKIASHLQDVLRSNGRRENGDFYLYPAEHLREDVEQHMWQSVARALDYYDCSLDAAQMQPIVQKLATALVEEVRVTAGIRHGVGAHEPSVPGEVLERVDIELTEDD